MTNEQVNALLAEALRYMGRRDYAQAEDILRQVQNALGKGVRKERMYYVTDPENPWQRSNR